MNNSKLQAFCLLVELKISPCRQSTWHYSPHRIISYSLYRRNTVFIYFEQMLEDTV